MTQESSIIASSASSKGGRYSTVASPEQPSGERNEELVEDLHDHMTSEIVSTPHHSYGRDTRWERRNLSMLSLGLSLCVLLLSLYVNEQRSTIHELQMKQSSTSNSSSNSTIPEKSQWRPLPPSDTVVTRVAFGSCARQDMPQPYWDTLSLTFQPQLVLLMGDNVYGDCDDAACTKLQKAYDDFAAHPSVQGAMRQFPVFPTLDDHDYGQGDCHADNPYKETARRKFASFYNIDWNELPEDDGVYRSRIWGPPGQQLQVILLDTRYGRSPFQATGNSTAPFTPITDPDQPQQMLSERQWAWLAEELEKPADLRVIVSSIQVLNDVCVFEAWRHLPKERDRLYELLWPQTNVLLLSGDRHVGAFLESADGGTVEVTASSWTHSIPLGAYGSNCSTPKECDEPDPRRIGDLVRVNHFGTLEIDWNTREYVVALRRAETTYGTMYHHKWDSDAGFVIQSRNYTISAYRK